MVAVIVTVALLSVAAFLAAFEYLNVLGVAGDAIRTAGGAVSVIRDGLLTDVDRERAAQRSAVRLFRLFLSILVRLALALAAGLLPVFLAHSLRLASWSAVTSFLARWDVIALVAVLLAMIHFARSRGWFRG